MDDDDHRLLEDFSDCVQNCSEDLVFLYARLSDEKLHQQNDHPAAAYDNNGEKRPVKEVRFELVVSAE